MKNLFFLKILIGSILLAILGSCSIVEESGTSINSVTTTTPSGSMTLGSYTVSGVYKSGCFTSGVSTLISQGAFPSDVKSYGFVFVVTGDTEFTRETHSFTDTGCTKSASTYITKEVRNNVTVGTAAGANYPVNYKKNGTKLTVNTTTAETWLENLYGNLGISLDMTVGTEKTLGGDGSTAYGLWTPGDTTIYLATESTSSTPGTAGVIVFNKE